MRPEDWSLNGVAIGGVTQPFIVQNAENWVKKYRLTKFISLSTCVSKVTWTSDHWKVETNRGIFRATHLVVATGVLNEPHIPEIQKTNPALVEYHSSTLRDPSVLKGKKVAVVGGSHSAWDLMELALKIGATEIHWVYRNCRWMIPSSRPKYEATDVRQLALAQFSIDSSRKISQLYQGLLDKRYSYFGLDSIKPKGSFDIQRHLLVGGRPNFIKRFQEVRRYQAVAEGIEGNQIIAGNHRIQADIVIYATGYRMSMPFLNISGDDSVNTQELLGRSCKVRCQSKDHPNLFFVGPTGVESNIVTPAYAVIISKTIVSAIRGKCVFPEKYFDNPFVHWDLIKELATFDKSNYSAFWKLKYWFLAWLYVKFPKLQVRI